MPNTKTKKAANTKSSNGTATAQKPNSQLEKFFVDQLKDIYWAEKHLLKALPKMQKAATTEQLQLAIEEHIGVTEEHVNRLDQVFEIMGRKPQAKKCDGMEGLITEGEHVVEETEDGSMTRDAGLIISAQKIEHYEICAYGGMVSLATTLGLDEVADLLKQTLAEEKETDVLLTEIAENDINWEAEQEGTEEEE
jgi:ferritin-like metal-binding protein YciE